MRLRIRIAAVDQCPHTKTRRVKRLPVTAGLEEWIEREIVAAFAFAERFSHSHRGPAAAGAVPIGGG